MKRGNCYRDSNSIAKATREQSFLFSLKGKFEVNNHEVSPLGDDFRLTFRPRLLVLSLFPYDFHF
jgi:hypothetical protein